MRSSTNRFTVNPFPDLHLTRDDRTQLLEIAHHLVLAKLDEYQDYLDNHKRVDTTRWRKYQTKGKTTTYIERKRSNPACRLPASLMVGPLPGSLDENMFGLLSPTLESMRIKSSYLNDVHAAAVLATLVHPTVDDPFRSVVVKWLEIDIPGASTGLIYNRDYVYLEATGILRLQNGERVGYHLLHSVHFPQTHELPHCIRGNMSLCGMFHEEEPHRTDCRGTGVLDLRGDLIHILGMQGMVHATMAGLKYSYCAHMKKLAWLVEMKHVHNMSEHGTTPVVQPECVTCKAKVHGLKTCTLCLQALCGACKIVKRLSSIAVDMELVQRKMNFCSRCILRAAHMDAQEAARVQFVYNQSHMSSMGGSVRAHSLDDSKSESTTSSYE